MIPAQSKVLDGILKFKNGGPRGPTPPPGGKGIF